MCNFTTQFEHDSAALYIVQVQSLNPTAASLEGFRKFPLINDDTIIANLAQELPLYLAAAQEVTVTCEDDKVTWRSVYKDASRAGRRSLKHC